MVAFVKSACAGLNRIAQGFNEFDRFAGQRNGERATRNYIPIGTGTLIKIHVVGNTALLVLLAQAFISDCYSKETQNKLTCHVIRDTFDCLNLADLFNTIFLVYRVNRNFVYRNLND
jgi:hypothetical protein